MLGEVETLDPARAPELGTVNSIDCRNENELYVGELGNWRVQRVTLKAAAAGTR